MKKKKRVFPDPQFTRRALEPVYDTERILATLWSDGHWFRFPAPLLEFLTEAEAILLAFLMNHARVNKSLERNKGWFYCRYITIQKKLKRYDKRKQSRIFRSLKKAGYITTILMGIPAQRWININYLLIWHDMDIITGDHEEAHQKDIQEQRNGHSDDQNGDE